MKTYVGYPELKPERENLGPAMDCDELLIAGAM
jgi:hypothetical protein